MDESWEVGADDGTLSLRRMSAQAGWGSGHAHFWSLEAPLLAGGKENAYPAVSARVQEPGHLALMFQREPHGM